jgi:hypothetical protein
MTSVEMTSVEMTSVEMSGVFVQNQRKALVGGTRSG